MREHSETLISSYPERETYGDSNVFYTGKRCILMGDLEVTGIRSGTSAWEAALSKRFWVILIIPSPKSFGGALKNGRCQDKVRWPFLRLGPENYN